MPSQDVYLASDSDEYGGQLHAFELTVDDGGFDLARRTVLSLEDDPSFLAVDPSGEYLYVVHESTDGAVTALRRRADGTLDRLNRVPSGAGGPCHCSVHPSGEYLFVTHYAGGAVSVLSIESDGRLSARGPTVYHEGSSVDSKRQTEAHPHSITPGPDGRYLYVPDLGTDEVVAYRFDDEEGSLSRVDATPTRSGAGPRHLAFHPDGHVGYVVNELDSTVSTFRLAADGGSLSQVATVSTVPDGYGGENFPSDVHVHPSGRCVYAANRGRDSIVAFRVDDPCDGLATLGRTSTGGHWPRTFRLDASGRYLLTANRRSGDVGVLRVDAATGNLEPTEHGVSVPGPTCLCCLPSR